MYYTLDDTYYHIQAPYNTPQDVASNSRSLVQVAEQVHPLVQRCPSPNPMREHRNNRTHEEVVVGGGRYSAWVTTGYPRGSCRESSRTRGNVDRRGRRKSGRTAWQIIFGYLASRGTGKPPHLTLGHGITPYKKGFVGLWPRGWAKKKMRPINGRRREKRKRRTRLRLHLG